MGRKKKISEGRPATRMEDGRHWPGRLMTPQELEMWGVSSVAEANAAIRAGKIRGPLIEGLTLVPFVNIPPSYKSEDDW